MTVYRHGASPEATSRRTIAALVEEIKALKTENERLRTALRDQGNKVPISCRYTVTEAQALRIAAYMARRPYDPNPTGVFGGPEGLEISTREAEMWDKRDKARRARERAAARIHRLGLAA